MIINDQKNEPKFFKFWSLIQKQIKRTILKWQLAIQWTKTIYKQTVVLLPDINI